MSMCRARSLSLFGIDAVPVEVEVDVSPGLPGFSIVGLPDAAVQEAARAGGVVVKSATPTPLGGSYAFFADPDGHLWEVIHHPLYRLGADGRPEVP